jgi:hypothetical protein
MHNEVENWEAEPEVSVQEKGGARKDPKMGRMRQEKEKSHDVPLGEAKRAFPRPVETTLQDSVTTCRQKCRGISL